MSRTRNAIDSAGTIFMLSSRAAWLSANWPVAPSEPASASSSSTRSSAGALSERRRRAPSNQRAALAGARCAAASPASRRTATAAASPWRAESATWCARAVDRGAARLERDGDALVRAQPPAARNRLVHGPADERMPEAKAPRNVGVSNEAESKQFVERLHRRRLARLRGGCGQLGLERLARDRGSLEHEARVIREQRELLAQRGCDGRGDVDAR